MLVALLSKPKEMESLDVDTIGDAANFLLDTPCKDGNEATLQQTEQVTASQDADLDVSFTFFIDDFV